MTLLGTLVFAVVLILLAGMSWRSLVRLEPLDARLGQFGQLQAEYRALAEGLLAGGVPGGAEGLRALAQSGSELSGQTQERLARAAELLVPGGDFAEDAEDAQARQRRALRLLGDALGAEAAEQQGLLRALQRDNAQELQAALATVVILPLLAVAYWVLFHRRVLQPLDDLGSAMSQLARRAFRTVDLTGLDPSIRPLFVQYNRLVGRLQELEAAHVKREAALRRELEEAAGALVRQQVVLGRADRFAASGDLAARLAHRLRSPLSGVLVTLTELREEAESTDGRHRLGMAVDAVERSLQELTVLVEESEPPPEAPRPTALRTLVDDLFRLFGHQADAEGVVLENAVPPDLHWRLPEAGTGHALMKLLINAAQAQRSAAGKRIRVSAEARGGELVIAVRDEGPGFPSEQLRAASSGSAPWSRRAGGLGLAIVRRYADHLGGRLVLENPPGGGAQALLIIPQVPNHG
jgi:signal transduction histidine kinase